MQYGTVPVRTLKATSICEKSQLNQAKSGSFTEGFA